MSISDSGSVASGGVFKLSCGLGSVGCKFAALNRGGAIAQSFVLSFLLCFACKIWGSSKGRLSVVSVYVPTAAGEEGHINSGRSRSVSCFCFLSFDFR